MCRSRRFLGIALAIFALAGGGCSSSPGSPSLFVLGPRPSAKAPVADSPQSLLRLFEWSYVNRDVGHYRMLFTDDFRFVFSALDPSGNAYRDSWTREQELEYFTHLVSGGGANPPVTSITLLLDRNFQVSEDPRRPGPWHRLIRTSVTLKVVGATEVEISGFANFVFTRGDSAQIPDELAAQGVRPDSTRWFIDRWEDDTFQAAGLRTMPTMKFTWGALKVLYLAAGS